MEHYYSAEINVQYLLALMKAHNIKNVIISPGTTNFTFVGSIQNDPYFNLISCVDERSAAYMACGIASVTKEPVAISCTGATASRNYIPAMTEAYYRKLPVLAITATRNTAEIGQNIDQIIDRSVIQKDIAKKSIYLPIPHSDEDKWGCMLKINDALLELRRNGGGPVHLNLSTEYNKDFSVRNLPKVKAIYRYTYGDAMPKIPKGSIAVFVGAHREWEPELTEAVEEFCEKYNAFVVCSQQSNYKGKYGVYTNIASEQKNIKYTVPDLLIHIGDVCGNSLISCNATWRVNPDGEIRDTFRKIRRVFEMSELAFFKYYNKKKEDKSDLSFYNYYDSTYDRLINKLTEKDIPFSNVWAAQQLYSKLPKNSRLFMGILNSLRAWNYFKVDDSILAYCNTGGFGIDGGMSSMVGASMVLKDNICYLITGDLAFFYDMNSIGNRDLGRNVRILLVNNAIGEEFKHNMTVISKAGFHEEANKYMAAEGHFGNKSRDLVRHYAEDLGFEYLSADNKEDFTKNVETFTNPEIGDKPILFEIFTDYQDETDAIEILQTLETDATVTSKNAIKKILGEKGVQAVKKVLNR